jgi:uncharacterized membrane protein
MRAFVGRHGLGALASVALSIATGCSESDGDPQGDGGGSSGGGPSWCEVSDVLAAKCRRCHVGQGLNGAPVALVTYADTQVEDAVGPRWVRMQKMVEDRTMPPIDSDLLPPPEPLTDDEAALLEEWFATGAKDVGGINCD